jgi:hypothetical protein
MFDRALLSLHLNFITGNSPKSTSIFIKKTITPSHPTIECLKFSDGRSEFQCYIGRCFF